MKSVQFNLIVVISTLFISCSKNFYFEKDRDILTSELRKMIHLDQLYRVKRANKRDSFILSKLAIIDKDSFVKLKQPWEKRTFLERKFSILIKYQNPELTFLKHQMDSLWELQTKIDSINTIRLIEIVKKYGFPSVDRLGAPVSARLIFQHSPKNFWRELNLLIKKTSVYDPDYCKYNFYLRCNILNAKDRPTFFFLKITEMLLYPANKV